MKLAVPVVSVPRRRRPSAAAARRGSPASLPFRRPWRPCWCSAVIPGPRRRGASSAPRSSSSPIPTPSPGMADAVDAVAAAVRAGGTILVHGDYDVDGQCATALLTRALREAGADVVPFVPHRLRDGYDFGPAGLAAAPADRRHADHHLRLRHHRGGDGARGRGRRASAWWSPITTFPGAELPPATAVVDPQRADDTLRARACSAAPASRSSWCRRWCRRSGCRPHLPYAPARLRGARHRGRRGAAHRREPHPGAARAPAAEPKPLAGPARADRDQRAGGERAPRRPGAASFSGPRLNAAGRIGEAADGLRLLLTDDADEARRWPAAGAAQHRAAGARPAHSRGGARPRSSGRPLDRRAGIVLASEAGIPAWWASSPPGWWSATAGRRSWSPSTARSEGIGPQHLPLRSAWRAARCGDLLERFGGHHMAAGSPSGAKARAFRERFERWRASACPGGPRSRAAGGPGDPADEVTDELERLCRHLEPCGMGNPRPVFGVRGVDSPGGSGSAAATEGRPRRRPGRLAAIGFQLGRPGALAGRWPGGRGVPPRAATSGGRLHAAGPALRYRSPRRRPAAGARRAVRDRRRHHRGFGGRRLSVPAGCAGAAHGRPGAGGLDEHPRRTRSPAPACSISSPGAARSASRRSRAAPRTADFVELSRASLAALRANIDGAGREPRGDGPPGDALRFVERLAPGATTSRSPTRPTPSMRRTGWWRSSARRPSPAFSRWSTGREPRRRRHPALRRHRPYFLPRPMTRIALYPGSFDPPTRGHEDLIRRSLRARRSGHRRRRDQSAKQPLFSVEERLDHAAHGRGRRAAGRFESFEGCWRIRPAVGRRSSCAGSGRSAISSTSSRWRS